METWNHNMYYHDLLLRAVPPNCQLALDAGCGNGLLARKLAKCCRQVIAIDADSETLAAARAANGTEQRITFVDGDAVRYSLEERSVDYIAALASLHHLPLRQALDRFRKLLKPGGVLAIVGLYRLQTIQDFAFAAVAHPASRVLRWMRDRSSQAEMPHGALKDPPLREPAETLRELRDAFETHLPGGQFKRHLFFRYSFIWHKP
jgi:SAM-dependent methyltransferase